MRANSLALRLFLAAAAWSIILLVVGAVLLSNIFRASVERSFDERLNVYLKTLIASSQWDEGGNLTSIGNVGEPRFDALFSGWYWQIRPVGANTNDIQTFASRSLWIERLPLPSEQGSAANVDGMHVAYLEGPQQEPLRAVERLLSFAEGERRYSFLVSGNTDEIEQEVGAFRNAVIWALGILGAALAATTLFQVRYGLQPLRRISHQLGNIRAGKAQRLHGNFPAEIVPLARELNALLDANSAIVARARTHVGNLAHALKTPLSVITNEADAGRGALAGKVVEQAAIMRDQISHHLERARMAARANIIGVVTDVRPTLEALVRTMNKIHGHDGVVVWLRQDQPILFSGERQDLEEIAGNLLDNACKWASERVDVEIDAAPRPGRDGLCMRMVIDDDGPGLTPDQRSEVMRRGARMDETKPGTGLGLSIVAELVQLYGGSFNLSASPAGGLRAEVELPATTGKV